MRCPTKKSAGTNEPRLAAFSQPQLEELIVTAQKISESAQDVPISIQAFDARTLERASITSLSDVRALVPGLAFKAFPTAQENLMPSLRGINGNAVEITQDNPAAVHVNGIYIPRGNGLNMSVAELERIEVLKGPQGTLYGRNATSGAINLITAKPYMDFGFNQQITVGNYGRVLSKTNVNIPLSENFAAKIAYLNSSYDGWLKSSRGGENFGAREAEGWRLDLRWKPSNVVTVDYSYDWAKTDYSNMPSQCLTAVGSNINPTTGARSVPAMATALQPGNCSQERMTTVQTPDPARISMPSKNSVVNEGHTLLVEWEASNTLTLRSLTGVRELRDAYANTYIVSPTAVFGGVGIQMGPQASFGAPMDITGDRAVSQEIQFIGRPSDYFKYTAGLYYFDEKADNHITLGNSYAASFDGGNNWLGGLNGVRVARAHNSSWAAFSQFSWTPDILSRKLEIIPGIRYTRDSRYASLYQGNGATWTYNASTGAQTFVPPAQAARINGVVDRDFSKTTPSLTLQYHWSEGLMVYGKVVKGYKAGGTQIRSSTTAAFSNGFAPENVTSTELGFKSDLMDRRLRINFAAFRSKFDDLQISVANPNATSPPCPSCYDVLNAGKATYQGWELEVAAAVSNALRLGLNWTHLSQRFDQVVSNGVDVTPYYHIVVPKDSYSLNADYEFGRVGPGKLSAHLDYSYFGKQSTTIADSFSATGALVSIIDPSYATTPSYSLVNGRIALSNIVVGPGNNGSLTVALWGKNLADKKYLAFGSNGGFFAGMTGIWGEPRTYGIDLIYRY
ncbi:hypothetical protein B9N43_04960 [Denitratisoma sp. DHT3]|uniref:TonB-dependent receptor n=1 Tax=Denitratisoma sp. DHT3 TaxID=1981880 RepID=UPI0011987266|nr:TonB-dependent receptor [Denitratisoma sp. DHT3]QDX80650.1 hypothetical protein B9N43_04960 [Denitratisoma sp. DHT3]